MELKLSEPNTSILKSDNSGSVIVPKNNLEIIYYENTSPESRNEIKTNNAFDILFKETIRM